MQRLSIFIPVTAGLILIAYFIYRPVIDLLTPCDSIFEQTAPRVDAKVQFIKTSGELVIGPEQVQKLAESSQKIGLHLKACCIMQKRAHMSAEQLQTCIDGAKNYVTRIVQMANLVGEAQAAREQGNAQLANERAAQATQLTGAVSAAERHLQEVVNGISAGDQPLPSGAKATILPFAAPSILPLKATVLPLKATVVPAGRSPPG